jgi:hypothetical protein
MLIYLPIIVAIATGLAVLAYRTPLIFKKMLYPLLIFYGVSQVVAVIYIVALSFFSLKLEPLIAADKMPQFRAFINSISISGFFYLYSFLAYLYVGFLFWLAEEVIKHKEPEKKM